MIGKPFHGFKVVEVRRFTSAEWLQWVDDSTPIPPKSKKKPPAENPASQILKLLKNWSCKTLVIERNYIDKDFKAEFSAFYAKRFCVPSPFCLRLHFFSSNAPLIGIVDVPSKLDPLIANKSAYLGFCVVRPTEFNRIGRTVIKYRGTSLSETDDEAYYVTCQAEFKNHLYGHELTVVGTPFIQQETQVSSCAHASLWVVGRYMHMSNYCKEILPDEVNDLAKARQPRGRYYPAESGLVPSQMLDALHGMGLSAIHYGSFDILDAAKDEQVPPEKHSHDTDLLGEVRKPKMNRRTRFLAKIVYPYIESGFPVILCLSNHVVVAVGHTLHLMPDPGETIDQIPSFLVNDDSVGPYVEFPLLPQDPPHPLYEPNEVTDIIAVLPASAKLKGEYAEAATRAFIRLFADEGSPKDVATHWTQDTGIKLRFPEKYRLRTYLMKSSDFQGDLLDPTRGKIPNEAIQLLLGINYPQYIWVTEIFSTSGGAKQPCVGKFVLDSTAAHSDRSIMAILMETSLVLFDRQNLDSMPFILPLTGRFALEPWTRTYNNDQPT